MENGRPHGKGQLKMPDGAFYDGEWADGMVHGTRVYRSTFGRMYNESDDKNLYIKSSDTKLSFVVEDVITWTRNKNAEIANIIEERRLVLRD